MGTLNVNTIADASGTGIVDVQGEGTATTNMQQGLAKQWCRIVQTSTQSIGDSFNTSGITDNGTGKTIYTFSNAMRAGTGYSILGTANQEGCGGEHSEMAAGQYEIRVQGNDGTLSDGSQVSTAIMGDLA